MKHKALYSATAALLVASGVWIYQANRPPVDPQAPVTGNTAAPSSAAPSSGITQNPELALAKAGLLWEPNADSREAQRTTVTIDPAPLRAAAVAAPGTRVSLNLSDRFPPIQGEVVGHIPHEDGTVVSYLRVDGKDGNPAGNLTIQENAPAGFFLAQLYYDNQHPIAYEIRPQGDAMAMTRHAVPDLICAELEPGSKRVLSTGMPLVDATAAADAQRKNQSAIDRALKNPDEGPGVASISVRSASATENAGKLLITVQLSKTETRKTITVNFATSDGSGKASSDYLAASGKLTFPPKTTVQTISVPLLNDSEIENTETFNVTLSAPVNATIAAASATGSILDDDSSPTISIANTTVNEGNSGQTAANVNISLSRAATAPVSVSYTTADGTAAAGSDYQATSGTITFNAGENTKGIPLAINGDTEVEASESFSVILSGANGADIANGQASVNILNDDAPPPTTPPVTQTPTDPNAFQSRPGAIGVIYLDMDGQTVTGTQWSSGTIVARGVTDVFNSEQMLEICKRVAEDYSPFDVNVTNSEAVYLAAPTNRRIRCIITPDNEWYGTAGGVAYTNSFTWTGDTPCWVFSDLLGNVVSYIAECCSHECGHTLGLRHDGRTTPYETYYRGQGDGEVGWAPIMGSAYYKLLTQWSKGEYSYASNLEDDLAIITTKNGFGYRPDDHGNSSSAATPLASSGYTLSGKGILETRDDTDAFSFSTGGGSVSLTATGNPISQDLDLEISLYDVNGRLVTSANPPSLTNATINTELPAGSYYLLVTGVGYDDPKTSGYSDYATIGQYTIQGTVP